MRSVRMRSFWNAQTEVGRRNKLPQKSTAEVIYMLLQLPPRAEAVLTCNYEPRVVKGWVGQVSQGVNRVCSRKMRMSGLSKVEMSAFMDGWGVHGDGAYRLEPARTGATEGAARGKAEAFDAGGGRRAAEGDRPSGTAAALGARGARGWCRGSRAARSSLESQAARFVRAKGSGPCAAAVC